MLGRDCAQHRDHAEAGDAEREHAPLAEDVAERPADQDQGAERQQVRVRDPLLPGQPAPEIGADRRQRHVDGGGVQPGDERPHDGREQAPAACCAPPSGAPGARHAHWQRSGAAGASRRPGNARRRPLVLTGTGGDVPPRFREVLDERHDPSRFLPDARPLQQLRRRARPALRAGAPQRRHLLELPSLLHAAWSSARRAAVRSPASRRAGASPRARKRLTRASARAVCASFPAPQGCACRPRRRSTSTSPRRARASG